MKTKEAIELLGKVVVWDEINEKIVELETSEASEIISLLKRGEKFEEMWGEGKKRLSYGFYNSIEQKYFPTKKVVIK